MRGKWKVWVAALLGLLGLGSGACDSLGPGDQGGPGVITATLFSPNELEGSAVFQVTGGLGLGLVSSSDGRVFYRHADGSTRVVVVMDEPGLVRFQVQTDDIGEPPEVEVLQVADGEDVLRASLAGYRVELDGRKETSSAATGGPAVIRPTLDLGPPFPAAYGQRLREDPDFFTLEGGWIHRTQEAVLGGSSVSGTLPVLLIEALFSDSPEPHVSHEDLEASLFFGPSEYGTLTEYYREVSGGRLEVTGVALPWVRTDVTLAQVVGDSYGLGDDAMTGTYLFQAVAAVDAAVDFGDFDNDGPDNHPNSGDDDGFVDAVAFQFLEVSASCGGPGIWPHRSRLSAWNDGEPYISDDPRAGGVGFIRVSDYTVQSAVDCGGVDVQKATTIAHELGHVLGLPDLYDRSQGLLPEERRWVVGCWDLMAAGSWGCGSTNRTEWVRPTHVGAWGTEQLGWLGGLTVVDNAMNQEFTLGPVGSGEEVLKIPLESGPVTAGTEYLLVEYRTQEGFDLDLPASGVLVYHVDPWIPGNQPCDTCPQQYMVELLEADGNNTLRLNFLEGGNRGEAGDAWGATGPGRLSRNTYPSTRLTSGDPSPVTIYEIRIEGGMAHVTLSTVEVPESRLAQPFILSPGPGPSAEELEYLDTRGNGNGMYDVGDFRAYLKR